MEQGKLKLITPPSAEPVTLAEAKEYSSIDSGFDNTLIMLLAAGREQAEQYLNRSLLEQTLELSFDTLPIEFELPKPPLISIESIKCYDEDGIEYGMSISDFDISDYGLVPKVTLKENADFLAIMPRNVDCFKVQYVAGYGTVPTKIKQAILMFVAWHFDHRDGTDNSEQFERAFYALLNGCRVQPL